MKISSDLLPLFMILPLVLLGMDVAYAQPIEDISATVLEFNGTNASVRLMWNQDDAAHGYEIGCISCMPNFSEKTNQNEIVLYNITSLANGNAFFYIIAYDDADEIIAAKQITIKIH